MKHEELTRIVEKNIQSKKYDDRLPTLRRLSADFGVSSRTMHKALKPLFTRGLIVSDSTRGCMINRTANVRPKTGIAGIFCDMEGVDLKTDPLLERLKRIINNDGYSPLFSNLPDATRFTDMNFWKSFYVDGCMFVYSSFNRNFASGLKMSGVPFLAANRVPDDYGANWVDFDTFGAFRKVADYLYERGYRRIALDFPVHLKSYGEYIRNEWTKLLQGYNIFRSEYLLMESYKTPAQRHDIIIKHAAALSALPEPPEAVICWHNAPELIRNVLKQKSSSLRIFAYKTKYETVQPGITYLSYPYDQLAIEVWNTFKTVTSEPNRESIHKLVELDTQVLI